MTLDGYAAVQAYVAENTCDATPEVKAALTRLDKIRWERQLAEHGYERTRMSPELAEALRNEIRRALDNDGKPFDVVVARRVYDLAIAAKDMCAAASSNVQEAINIIADQNGPLESLTDPGTPESQAQASESFGARLIRELLAIVKPRPVAADESPLDLVHALAEARRAGMTDVAAELEQRLLGKKLDGEKPIAPTIDVPVGTYEHGFADGKAGALPTFKPADAPEYERGYLAGTHARFLPPTKQPEPEPVPLRTFRPVDPTVRLDDGPKCQEKGTCQCFDGCGSCDGCGRWLGDEETPVAHDPPLCEACLQSPDPRGGSACFQCREIAAHRGDKFRHAFQPLKTNYFNGPVGETCEYCGKDPRNTIHVGHKEAQDQRSREHARKAALV